MNSKHAFLALSTFTLVSIAYGEREVFAPTKLAPTATAANGNITFSNVTPFWTGANIYSTSNFGIGPTTASILSFHNNGAERMRITSAGNVFVGNGETAASVANGNIRATGGSGTNINGADLVLHGGQSTGTAVGGALRFFTAPAGGVSGTSVNASTERMRIDSAGNVGIGTTTPRNELEVVGGNSPRISIRGNNEATNNELELGFQYGTATNASSNTAAIIRAIATQVDPLALIADLAFNTNSGDQSVERFRITGAGDIVAGNGDTSATPAASTIRGTNASGTDVAAANLTIRGGRGTGTGAGGALVFETSAAGAAGSTLNAATERMRINSAGAVMLNTTTVSNDTLNVNGRIGQTQSETHVWRDSSTNETAGIVGTSVDANNGYLSLRTRGGGTASEKARVKQGGQLRFVPLSAAPTANVEDGDVYYNSTTNKLQVRAAGVWVDLH